MHLQLCANKQAVRQTLRQTTQSLCVLYYDKKAVQHYGTVAVVRRR